MSNTIHLSLANLDKQIQYLVVSNAKSLCRTNNNQYIFTGDSVKIEANVPLTESIRSSLDVVVENFGHLAFGHYFFESVVLAAYLWEQFGLDERNRAIVSESRVFKRLLMDYIGIQLTEKFDETRKLLIVRREMSLNINSDELYFKSIVEWFSYKFVCLYQPKTRPITFLPRQSKENFKENDRFHEYSGISEFVESTDGGVVLNTDYSSSFKFQTEIVQQSKFLVVPDGSGFTVNSFFCRDSTIVVLGYDLVPNQVRTYDKLKVVKDLIESRNSVVYVKARNNRFFIDDLLPILNRTYLF
jgi:hypothetical protein